ncbi:MAG: thioredoxin [Clostridia bacterium]|nr:thioredoxin [Clostridia bacterium]
MVREVNEEEFQKEIGIEGTILVDFFATWCPPCKALGPIVEEFASEHEEIRVLKVNVDNEQRLAIENSVMSVPTLIVIKNGKVTNRSVGLIDKRDIEKLLG